MQDLWQCFEGSLLDAILALCSWPSSPNLYRRQSFRSQMEAIVRSCRTCIDPSLASFSALAVIALCSVWLRLTRTTSTSLCL